MELCATSKNNRLDCGGDPDCGLFAHFQYVYFIPLLCFLGLFNSCFSMSRNVSAQQFISNKPRFNSLDFGATLKFWNKAVLVDVLILWTTFRTYLTTLNTSTCTHLGYYLCTCMILYVLLNTCIFAYFILGTFVLDSCDLYVLCKCIEMLHMHTTPVIRFLGRLIRHWFSSKSQ